MTFDQERAQELFDKVVKLPSAEREQFLDKECNDDDSLRAELESRIEHHFSQAITRGEDSKQSASLDYQPGDTIDRFKILNILGEGGMGIVYLAEQSKPVKRRVALKVIKAGMDTKQVIARFEAERQALAIMNHPGINQVYEAGATKEGRPYFVMKYVKGLSITEACDEHKLDTTQRLKLFAKVCDAVQHAHMKGIIHRDLKPTNIMVSAEDGDVLEPKIIDFGLAKATSQQLTDKTLVTQLGKFIGTPAYMSPEQADAKASDIDTRSDVYALGVILYEVLTGRPPFDPQVLRDAGLEKMREIIREEEPPKPSTRLSTLEGLNATKIAKARQTQIDTLAGLLRKELEWIPLMALRKLPSERYDSAKSMGDDIHRYLNGEPLEAGPESASYRIKKTLHKHKGPFIAAVIVAFVLIGGIIGTSTGWRNAQKQTIIADEAKQTSIEALNAEIETSKKLEESLEKEKEAKKEAKEALRKQRELTTARDISVDFAADMISGDQLKEAALESGIEDYEKFFDLWLTKTVETARDRYEGEDEHAQQALASVLLQVGFSYLTGKDFKNASNHMLEGVELYHQLHESDHQAWINTRNVAPALMLLHGVEGFEFVKNELDNQQTTRVSELWIDAKPHDFVLSEEDQSAILQTLISGHDDEESLTVVYQTIMSQIALGQPIGIDSIDVQARFLNVIQKREVPTWILKPLLKSIELLGFAKPRECVDELCAIGYEYVYVFLVSRGDISRGFQNPRLAQVLVRTAAWFSDFGFQELLDSLGPSPFSDAWRDFMLIFDNEQLMQVASDFQREPDLHTQEEWAALTADAVNPVIAEVYSYADGVVLVTAWNESWTNQDFRDAIVKKLEPFREIGITFEIDESRDTPSVSWDVDYVVLLFELVPNFEENLVETTELLGFSNPRECSIEFLSILGESFNLYVAARGEPTELIKSPQSVLLITRVITRSSYYGLQEVVDSLGSRTLSDAWRNIVAIFQDSDLTQLADDFMRNPDLHTQEEWTTLIEDATVAWSEADNQRYHDLETALNESWKDRDFRDALVKKLAALQKIGIVFEIDESGDTPSVSLDFDYSVYEEESGSD